MATSGEPEGRGAAGGAPDLGRALRAAESFEVESSPSPGEARAARAASWRLFAAVGLACLAPLLFGFSMGFTSPVQPSMEGRPKGAGGSVVVFPPSHLSVFSAGEFTTYAAAINVGGLFGALAGSAAMDRVGRKNALALSAIPHLAAWVGTYLTSRPILLTLLRVLTGFGVGMGTTVAPCYIGEVSTPRLRGPLGVAVQLSMNIGRLFVNAAGAYALAVDEVGGHCFCNWRRLSLFGVAFAALLSAIVLMPESPRWLAQRGEQQAARLALRALRHGDTAEEEAELDGMPLSRMSDASTLSSNSSESSVASRSVLDYKRSLLVAVGLICFQQLSGINAIMMYAMDICAQTGMQSAELSCVLIMVAQVFLGMLPCMLVQAVGRRPLLKFAAVAMCTSHMGLSYYMAARSSAGWAPPWLALASLGVYVVGFSTGMGPVPWVMLPEVFPVEVVGLASAIACGAGWCCSLFVCVQFRALQATLGASGVFMLFGVCCAACLFFVSAFVPETKDKTLEQVLLGLRSSARSVGLDRQAKAWINA